MAIYMVYAESDRVGVEYVNSYIVEKLPLPSQPGNVTTNYNNIQQRKDGKWILLYPGRNDLIPPDAPPFTLEEFDPNWFV